MREMGAESNGRLARRIRPWIVHEEIKSCLQNEQNVILEKASSSISSKRDENKEVSTYFLAGSATVFKNEMSYA